MAKTVIERALELASDGKHRTVTEIRETLRAERYERVLENLAGKSIIDQLKARIRKARVENYTSHNMC